MKVLNLDSLAPKVARTIQIGGVVHVVVEMTVENFIATSTEAERLENDPNATVADKVKSTVEMIKRSVPSIETETLHGLSLEQLGVIAKFLRGAYDSEEEVRKELGSEGEDEKK